MKLLQIKRFLIYLVLLSPSPALAKLGAIDFSLMLKGSDLVVYGITTGAMYNDDGSGYGFIKVKKTLFGASVNERVKINWSDNRYDLNISRLFAEGVFFLKKQGDGYIGVSMARSFWEVVPAHLVTDKGWVEVLDGGTVQPFAVKGIPAKVFSDPKQLDCRLYTDCEKPRITVQSLFFYLKSHKQDDQHSIMN